MSEKLHEIYFDLTNPASFGGVKRLKDGSKCSQTEVKQFLQSQEAYTRHKQKYSKFRRLKIATPCMNYLWQADLIFMNKYKKFNKGFQYILSVIDTFSRIGFAIPLKNKTSAEIIRGFQEIFSVHKRQPKYLQCDEGKEFFCKAFQEFLKQHRVILYHNFSEFKACMVERFNRTLLTRLSKYFTYSGAFEYISILPNLIQGYNDTVHRSIGVSPNSVNKRNQMDIWLYSNRDLYIEPSTPPGLNLFDRVRLMKWKGIFEKGYSCTYTKEMFEVAEIIDSVPVTYRIQDLSGKLISGVFYEQELVRVRNKS